MGPQLLNYRENVIFDAVIINNFAIMGRESTRLRFFVSHQLAITTKRGY